MSPEEFARYQAAGEAATVAHRLKQTPFPRTRASSSAALAAQASSAALRDVLEPGAVTETGAIVAADAVCGAAQLEAYRGVAFEMQYRDFKRALPKQTDDLLLTADEEKSLLQWETQTSGPLTSHLEQMRGFLGLQLRRAGTVNAALTVTQWQPPTGDVVEAWIGLRFSSWCFFLDSSSSLTTRQLYSPGPQETCSCTGLSTHSCPVLSTPSCDFQLGLPCILSPEFQNAN